MYPYIDNLEAYLCPVARNRLPVNPGWRNAQVAHNYVQNYNCGIEDGNGGLSYTLESVKNTSDLLLYGEENTFTINSPRHSLFTMNDHDAILRSLQGLNP